MSGAGLPGAPAPSSPPWWDNDLRGAIALGAGFGLAVFGYLAGAPTVELAGATIIGSGVTFLGVSSGKNASA